MLKRNFIIALAGAVAMAAPAAAQVCHVMELTVGQQVQIVLPGNPTTGYIWSVAESTPAVKVEISLDQSPDHEGMAGCPRFSFVEVTAVQAGQGQVLLVYARPWEKDKAPADTCRIDVTVK